MPIDHLELRDELFANGFCHIPGALEGWEVQRLRAAFDELTDAERVADTPNEDFKYGALAGGEQDDKLCRIEYSFEKHVVFLAVAAHPTVVALARLFHGEAPIVTWEDVIVKSPGGCGVNTHQDRLHQSGGRVFSIGCYFDPSHHDPLYGYPGTQTRGFLDERQLERVEASCERRTFPAEAGDLVVHDVKAVHGSRPNRSPRVRRVLYLEFRTETQLTTDSPWGPEWIAGRRRLHDFAEQARTWIGRRTSVPVAESRSIYREMGLTSAHLRFPH